MYVCRSGSGSGTDPMGAPVTSSPLATRLGGPSGPGPDARRARTGRGDGHRDRLRDHEEHT